MLSMIVAMTEDRVIGKNNELPWPMIKEDMQHFKKITTGHAVIMGRKTWDSIPDKFKPLPKRTNVVVTRQDLKLGGAIVCNSLAEAIDCAKDVDDNPFIIGGASLYEESLPLVNQIYLTLIKNTYEGDTYFPALSKQDWKQSLLSETEKAAFYLYQRSI